MNKSITISHLKLPFTFDVDLLRKDLDVCLTNSWLPHFNSSVYSGEWNSIALYAPNGDPTNIVALQSKAAPLTPTAILKDCTYLDEVIQTFKCKVTSARLLNLKAGASIKPHTDHNMGYEDGCFRIHIPITTNPKVTFLLNEEKLVMNPGECWYTNVNFVHSVSNYGNSDRVHIIIDGLRNKWSDELFFSLASRDHLLPEIKVVYDKDTIIKMIAELKAIDTPVAEKLIKNLSTELD